LEITGIICLRFICTTGQHQFTIFFDFSEVSKWSNFGEAERAKVTSERLLINWGWLSDEDELESRLYSYRKTNWKKKR
jgi:hypothetical protein